MPEIKRRQPSLTEKLASALLNIVTPDGKGGYVPVLDREECRDMTAAQVCSLFSYDHGKLHALASDQDEAEALMHPVNLTPRLIVPHREKSKGDTTAVAKTKRLSAENEDFQRRLLAKAGAEPPPDRKRKSRPMPSRPFPKVQRPMGSKSSWGKGKVG